MSVNELSRYIFASKYARWDESKQRRETWQECVDRIENMMLKKYENVPSIHDDIRWAYSLMRDKRLVGSQRVTQFGGDGIFKHNMRGYNCSFIYIDKLLSFQHIKYALLCGCGVGFSVQKHHIDQLPSFGSHLLTGQPIIEGITYEIEDTIESWSDSIGVLLSSIFEEPVPGFEQFHHKYVEFDYSKIRSKGSKIANSNGFAPGPEPLRIAHNRIKSLLLTRIKEGYQRARPVDAFDVTMHLADAVLSGGIRRSACLTLFSIDDIEMSQAKIGNWYYENPQRARANISVSLKRDEVEFEEFKKIILNAKSYGEPGVFFVSDFEDGCNPCLSFDTRLATADGLVKIGEMNFEGSNDVMVDNRQINKTLGTSTLEATAVKLTQKNVDVYRVETEHGYYVDATTNHTFITLDGRKQLKDLAIGDKLMLQSGDGSFGTIGNYNQGFILGLLTSNGTFGKKEAYLSIWEQDFDQLEKIERMCNEEIKSIKSLYPTLTSRKSSFNTCTKVGNFDKKTINSRKLFRLLQQKLDISDPTFIKHEIPECVFRGSRDLVIGYLHGFFMGDDTINFTGNGTKATLSVRFGQSNKKMLQQIQIILSNFGIVSRLYHRKKAGITIMPDSNRQSKTYHCKDFYELVINRPNSINYFNKIGFFGRKKEIFLERLGRRGLECKKPERYISKIKSIDYLGKQDVYCLTQPESNSIITNGIINGNCSEIVLSGHLESDYTKTGMQVCNLSEINGLKIKNKEEFYECCRAASIIGTLQAGFDEFPYLGEVSEQIIKREALLGVSISGIMDAADILLDPETQKKGAEIVVETNKEFAAKIGIQPGSRCTTVKPSGTTSLVFGCSAGIHPRHAKRYIRRVQANKIEPIYQYFKSVNPQACKASLNSGGDDVITFCVEVDSASRYKDDVSAIELLEAVKLTKENWIEYGTNHKQLVKPHLRHNISNTISIKDDQEWEDVIEYIYKNRNIFGGLTLMSSAGDRDYSDAPYVQVFTPREITNMYGAGSIFASGLITKALELWDDNLWKACDVALGIGDSKDLLNEKLKEIEEEFKAGEMVQSEMTLMIKKIEWLEDLQKFATNYLEGDIKKTTYLLKDVFNWKLFCDLKREYKKVDYSECIETKDNTRHEYEIACAGGQCYLI